jgi:uncharacterized NAD(P)/FAD-binding protein YdhS
LASIGIIGLGPWGLCALERIVTTARGGLPHGITVEVHAIEPRAPGSGIYDTTQPDYLLLNNPCGQLSLYPFASEADQPRYGIGLYDWAVRRGYRWVGDRCVIDPAGSPIEAHHFLPRRLMGGYLNWFYRALVAEAPPSVRITHHSQLAVDIVSRSDGSEEVRLADGETVAVDYVILTTGHTANRRSGDGRSRPREQEPFPVTTYVDQLPAGMTVGVAGMGLTSVDVVTALTIGRGGKYVENGKLQYQPSGREPKIHVFSRSGLPFVAKSLTGPDRTNVYKPLICTREALDELSGRNNGTRRPVEVRTELLPLLFAEMHARYYAQKAFQAGSAADGAAVREQLRAAWDQGRFDAAVDELATRFDRFDPEALFWGREGKYETSQDYERFVYDALVDDLREAEVPDGASPVKSAAEVLRIFRDPTRSIVEQGGISIDSYLDFNADIRSRITRLVAGPPALRSRQYLALMDAGVLRVPYGPAPAIGHSVNGGELRAGKTRISSTALVEPHAGDVDVIIRGYLEDPRIADSESELLTHLHESGRISQFRYGTVTVGSIDLTEDSHPIDVGGEAQTRIWVFGMLTEGIRHFNHYIPSPNSRIKAVEDIGACVADILDSCASDFLDSWVAETLDSYAGVVAR